MELLIFCVFVGLLLFALIYKLIGNSKAVLRLDLPQRKFYSGEDLEVTVHCYSKKRLEGLSALLLDFSLGKTQYPKYQKKLIVEMPSQLEGATSFEKKVTFKIPYWEELEDRIEDEGLDKLSFQLNYYTSGSIKVTLPLPGIDSYKIRTFRVYFRRKDKKRAA